VLYDMIDNHLVTLGKSATLIVSNMAPHDFSNMTGFIGHGQQKAASNANSSAYASAVLEWASRRRALLSESEDTGSKSAGITRIESVNSWDGILEESGGDMTGYTMYVRDHWPGLKELEMAFTLTPPRGLWKRGSSVKPTSPD
jgi:hypothetical protein